MFNLKNKKRFTHNEFFSAGFTLVELLVVISIISLLSSVVFSSVSGAKVKARDAKRVSDIYQISLALRLYYETNGSYPTSQPSNGGIGGVYATSKSNVSSPNYAASWNSLKILLAPYIVLPDDPINSGPGDPWYGGLGYTYIASDGSDYDLFANYENKSNPNRCIVRNWIMHAVPGRVGQSWCAPSIPLYYYNYIKDSLFADH